MVGLMVAMAIFSFLLYCGTIINTRLSNKSCHGTYVIAKEFVKGGHRRINHHYLYILLNGKRERVDSSSEYWEYINVGQQIEVCEYTSKLGFDFLSLAEE
jgi:hypothetical protein